jgi:hypothetical protein
MGYMEINVAIYTRCVKTDAEKENTLFLSTLSTPSGTGDGKYILYSAQTDLTIRVAK